MNKEKPRPEGGARLNGGARSERRNVITTIDRLKCSRRAVVN